MTKKGTPRQRSRTSSNLTATGGSPLTRPASSATAKLNKTESLPGVGSVRCQSLTRGARSSANVPGLEKPNGTVTVPIYKGRPQVPADGHFETVSEHKPEPEKPDGTMTVPIIHHGPRLSPQDYAINMKPKQPVDQPVSEQPAQDESA